MASELRVNTLKDANGNNSIATSTVAQGSAKAWSNFDQRTSLSVSDSFNLSSQSDVEAGNIAITLSNNMSDGNYVVAGLGHYIDSSENPLVPGMGLRRGVAKTSSVYETQTTTAVWSASAVGADVDSVMTVVQGDLA